MKIISDDCKKLIEIIKQHDKWIIKFLHYGKFYLYRDIKDVKLELVDNVMYINNREQKYKNIFNFIESFYLNREAHKLVKFKIEQYNNNVINELIGAMDEDNK